MFLIRAGETTGQEKDGILDSASVDGRGEEIKGTLTLQQNLQRVFSNVYSVFLCFNRTNNCVFF